ncbi:MAG: zinc-binding dehydrogenase [Alphaproteobacteria bacterium]|nr:zinc-binding dehydrogenase [Alphaproteobacteria bacterium]MCB9931066.1 zinc-binding dehydrogenase [Alphaproteobacteria bacterium]
MKAVVVTEAGVRIQDVPRPAPKPNEVLVRVRACGLNRADLMVASGMAHGASGGAGTIVGLEFCGEIVDLGAEAKAESTLAVGDRVMCGGAAGWAEYAVADWGRAAKLPDANVSWHEAATLSTALNTMHNAVATAGRMTAGESVLVQGASSGVGLMAMQIAKFLGASQVMGTSTNAERRARLKDFGCDLALDSRDPGWADRVLEATGGAGVDLIVDNVSGYTVNDSLRCTKVLGRIVNVGRLGGFQGEFNFDLHAARRIDYIGVTFRTRSMAEIREINRRMQADLGGAVAEGKLRLPIDSVYPFERVADALAHMKANAHFGKIVLEGPAD